MLGLLRLPVESANTGTGQTFKVDVISNLILMPGFINNSPQLSVSLDPGSTFSVMVPEHIPTLPINYVSQQIGDPVGAIFGSNLFQNFAIRVSIVWPQGQRMEAPFGRQRTNGLR